MDKTGETRVKIYYGFPNRVGVDRVGVMQSAADEGYVRFGILHGEIGSGDEEVVEALVGDLVTISGVTWRVVSVHERSPLVEVDGVPVMGGGGLAVVIEMDPPGTPPVAPVETWTSRPPVSTVVPRQEWVDPPGAPRPRVERSHVLDLVAQPDAQAAPEPSTRYEVRLPGGIEATYYTDTAGLVRYFETVAGTFREPNPVLVAPQPEATYAVNYRDRRGRVHCAVLRTDALGRVVRAADDDVAFIEGQGGTLIASWPGQVSVFHLLSDLTPAASQAVEVLGRDLTTAMSRSRIAVTVHATYDTDGPDAAPARLQVDYSIDGQAATQTIDNR